MFAKHLKRLLCNFYDFLPFSLFYCRLQQSTKLILFETFIRKAKEIKIFIFYRFFPKNVYRKAIKRKNHLA